MFNDGYYDPPEYDEDEISWAVNYDTTPTPGATYYNGWRLVLARTEDEAREKCKALVSRNFPEYKWGNHVRIRQCYQSNKLPVIETD